MPDRTTVVRWLDVHKEFCISYARARDAGLAAMADELVAIADDATQDFDRIEVAPGVMAEQFNSEHVQRSKLRVDTRKWILSKLVPKTYGDRIEVEHKGSVTLEHRLAAGRRRSAAT